MKPTSLFRTVMDGLQRLPSVSFQGSSLLALLYSLTFSPLIWANVKSTTSQVDFILGSNHTASMNGHTFLMNGNIHLTGALSHSVAMANSSTSLGNHNLILANPSSSDLTLTLPYSGNAQGRVLSIKKTNTLHDLRVVALSSDNIDGATGAHHKFPSSSKNFVQFVSDGKQWYQLSETVLSKEYIISSSSNLSSSGNITIASTLDEIYLTLPNAALYSGESVIVNVSNSANITHVEANGSLVSNWPSQSVSAGNSMVFSSNGSLWSVGSHSNTSGNVAFQSNLMAWWSFNESANNFSSLGNCHDSSGNLHHLSPISVPSSNVGLDGVYGRAIALGNVNSHGGYLQTTDLIGQDAAQASFAMWVYIHTTTGDEMSIFDSRNSESGGLLMALEGGNRLKLKMANAARSSQMVTTKKTVATGQWLHLIATYNTGTVKIYIDSTLNSTNSGFQTTLGTPRNSFSMMAKTNSNGNPQGHPCGGQLIVDDLRIYNFELSSSQVNSIYLDGLARQ